MEQIRPFPPTDLIDQAEAEETIRLAPAVDLKEWVVKNWLTIGGELHNPDHDHIAELIHDDETFLAFAWASSAAMAKKRMVLGQCEKVMFNQGGWKKARQEQQMRDWFGFVPVYLITVDASYCENTTDREFCRLIEHELYHIGIERDEDGEAIYSDHTGLMELDDLLDRVWTSEYTCNEFACEAWQKITGEDLTQRLTDFLNGSSGFTSHEEPISPCIVFFTNGKQTPTHVGVFFEQKLLHLSMRGGQYVPLDIVKMNFRQARYYT